MEASEETFLDEDTPLQELWRLPGKDARVLSKLVPTCGSGDTRNFETELSEK